LFGSLNIPRNNSLHQLVSTRTTW